MVFIWTDGLYLLWISSYLEYRVVWAAYAASVQVFVVGGPPTHSLDVSLGQKLEHSADVQVLLDRGPEQLQSRVPGEFLHLITEKLKVCTVEIGKEWILLGMDNLLSEGVTYIFLVHDRYGRNKRNAIKITDL